MTNDTMTDNMMTYLENYKIAADVELMLRFLEVHEVSSSFISETLVVMKDGGRSNNGLLSKWIIFKEVIRAHQENNLKINETTDIILGAKYNKEDITKQILEYLGPSGKHLGYYKLLVRDVLTEEQISNFEKLTIIDEMCEINELVGLNEYIL